VTFALNRYTYEPPLVKRGFLVDAIRGKVRFSRFTNTPIPWPKFQNQSKGGSGGIVLCGDLIRALTDESGPAVAYHWGVCQGTVRTWRRALELKGRNAGSHRLIEKGVALARRPESQAKHSAAMRAKALSPTHRSHLFAAIKVWRKERFEARRNVMGGPGDFRRRPNWTRGYRRKKMKHFINFHPGVLRSVGLSSRLASERRVRTPDTAGRRPKLNKKQRRNKTTLTRRKLLSVQTLRERLPDQAHAMADVGYHFANLWFAAEKQNWPLANYYLGETRSHLRWAVRIHPVRKTKAGAVDLNGMAMRRLMMPAGERSFFSKTARFVTPQPGTGKHNDRRTRAKPRRHFWPARWFWLKLQLHESPGRIGARLGCSHLGPFPRESDDGCSRHHHADSRSLRRESPQCDCLFVNLDRPCRLFPNRCLAPAPASSPASTPAIGIMPPRVSNITSRWRICPRPTAPLRLGTLRRW
jgi:hypothetical protein